MSEKKKGKHRPTLKKDLFVASLMKQGDEGQAMVDAGYSTNKKSMSCKLYDLRRDTYVQRKIEELIAERYPDHEEDFFSILKKLTKHVLDEDTPHAHKLGLELLRLHSTLKGYNAPSKSITAKIPAPPVSLLPREQEEDISVVSSAPVEPDKDDSND